jgi:hypothetical protein
MRRHLAVLVAVVAAIGAGLFLLWRHSKAPVPVGSDSAEAPRLASEVVTALEKDPNFRREVSHDPDLRPVCVARAFGVDSPSGTGEGIETIYAWIFCRWIPATAAAASIDPRPIGGVSGPIVVHLGPTTTYEIPADGEHYDSNLKKMFPSSLLEVARDGVSAPLDSELDKRISQELPRPSPSST